MNTALLRHARRDPDGTRRWTLPGAHDDVLLIPQRLTPRGWGDAFYWPDIDRDGDPVHCGVDLNRHRCIALRTIPGLLDRLPVAA